MDKTFKLLFFSFFCFFFTTPNILFAYQLPAKAYGMPKVFDQNNGKSYRWQKIAKSHDFGEQTQNPWIVYSVNEGAVAYESPSSGSRSVPSDIHFMEDFYVANIQGEFAQLFYYDETLDGLSIPAEISRNVSKSNGSRRSNGYIGWVKLNDLLLWSIAPRTEDGIFQKIAIVKDIEHQNEGSINSMPKMYVDAECTQLSTPIKELNALDFYFTLKKNDTGNALVYVNYQLSGNMRMAKVGWVEYGEYIDWNTRICWEPAFEGDINDMAYTFETEDATWDYDLTHKRSSVALSNKRKSTQFEPRSPVIGYENRIASLSVLANTTGNNADISQILQKIDALKKSLSTINVVFVIDATNSMKSCFSAMSNAVEKITKYRYSKGIRFGVVAYRNYADETSGKLVSACPLTDNLDQVSKFLSNTECYSVSRDPQEAMFYGLNYAVDNMSWQPDNSNFIILISDVSSKDPDDKGITEAKIIDKLARKKINVVAFQARSQQRFEYQNFGSQVNNIIRGTLQKLEYSVKSPEYDEKTQIFLYNQTSKWPLRPMGYKFKDSDEQTINASELTNMATNIIKDFIETTQENITRLESQIGNSSEQVIDQSVCDELIRKHIIRKCEDLKGIIRVSGYATMQHNTKNMFTPCVFMADKELNDLIKDLEGATKGTMTNRRSKLQDVFKRLILSYTGQTFDKNTIDTDFSHIISEVEQECQYKFYDDVKKHVNNPNLLSDEELQTLTERLNRSINHLKKIQNDRTSYKDQDGKKYYYVLLKDMPLVKSWNN